MPITLADARSDLRARLDETTPNFWTDDQLNGWVNEACFDIAKRTESLQQLATIPATALVRQYFLPADVVRIHKVEYTAPNSVQIYPLEYRGLQEMDAIWGLNQLTSNIYPSYWTTWFSPPTLQMLVFPVPASAGQFNVWYYRLPATVTKDTTNIDCPEGWWDAVVLYAEYVAKRKDADPDWKDAKDLYLEKLQQLLDTSRNWTDSAGVISTGAAQVPYWLYGGSWEF